MKKIYKIGIIAVGGIVGLSLLGSVGQQEQQEYFDGGGWSGAPLASSKYDDLSGVVATPAPSYTFEAPVFPEVQSTAYSDPITKKSSSRRSSKKSSFGVSSAQAVVESAKQADSVFGMGQSTPLTVAIEKKALQTGQSTVDPSTLNTGAKVKKKGTAYVGALKK